MKVIKNKQNAITVGLALLLLVAGVAIWVGYGVFRQHARQANVAARGSQVMPFDLEQTTHVFQKMDDGGVQRVTAKESSNSEQIDLIQAHIQEEADKFQRGDFSDPAHIHGQQMPGLAELTAGASQIDVRYTPLADGAQIRYTTSEPNLISAIHDWFEAQLSDHGAHAESGHN